MDYELYHDESKEGGFWHGMLLVPIVKKHTLLNLLSQARENTNYSEPISIKQVRKQGGFTVVLIPLFKSELHHACHEQRANLTLYF